jgi:hypothetical protein
MIPIRILGPLKLFGMSIASQPLDLGDSATRISLLTFVSTRFRIRLYVAIIKAANNTITVAVITMILSIHLKFLNC